MQVRALMSPEVRTIRAEQSCHDALVTMCRARIRHLIVVDETARVVGVVTDRDLRHRLFSAEVFERIGQVSIEALLREAAIEAVMSTPVVTIGPDADVADAAALMREAKIGSLPVLEGGRLVGIITEIDVLRHVAGADRATTPEMEIVVSFP